MAKKKTFFGRLIADIVSLIGSVFQHSIRGAEKDYENLPEADKQALQHGAGVFTFIGQELDKQPAILREEILTRFPDLDVAKLEAGLYQIAKAFNLAPEANNLDDTISKLQEHLKGLQGTTWDAIVQAAAGIFSVFVAPAGSKIGAAFDLVKYVYLRFFKK